MHVPLVTGVTSLLGMAARRQSDWQQIKSVTVKRATKVAEGVGRWFGVAGDHQAMAAQYKNRSGTQCT